MPNDDGFGKGMRMSESRAGANLIFSSFSILPIQPNLQLSESILQNLEKIENFFKNFSNLSMAKRENKKLTSKRYNFILHKLAQQKLMYSFSFLTWIRPFSLEPKILQILKLEIAKTIRPLLYRWKLFCSIFQTFCYFSSISKNY